MENNYYSVDEISKMFGVCKMTIYRTIRSKKIKADFVVIGENYRPKRMFLFSNILKHFNYTFYIPIPKKERKPYFEFSEITLKSKINGTN